MLFRSGIYDKHGSISVGKKADVVLLSQEGLEVRNIIMDGKLL